jgi:hypothetical protein
MLKELYLLTWVDNASQKIVWQGRATKTLDEDISAEKREHNINYAVKENFFKVSSR